MPFDHRYLWNSDFVRELLRRDGLSEAAVFRYFLAITGFDWLQFAVAATIPVPHIEPWSAASAWASFAITLLGLVYLYLKNGAAQGKRFLSRYVALSVVVGWKFVLAAALAFWLATLVLASGGPEVSGWTNAVALAAVNIAMFWRIGFHLGLLACENET